MSKGNQTKRSGKETRQAVQLTKEQVRDLAAALDYAIAGPTIEDVLARWPKLPVDDDRLLPPVLRRKYDQFLGVVALKTFTG